MEFENPPDDVIAELLRRAATVAVVGLSAKSSRPSARVAVGLIRYGYDIIPVNPHLANWHGRTAVPDLETAVAQTRGSGRIDIVDVFRRPGHVDAIVSECIRLELPALWLQLGVIDPEAARRARDAGLTVVMDRCLYVERARLG